KKNELIQEMLNKINNLETSVYSDFQHLNRSQKNRIFENCSTISKICNELKDLEETEKAYGNRLKRIFLLLHRLSRYLSKEKLLSTNQLVDEIQSTHEMVEEIRNLLNEIRRKFPPIPISIHLDVSNVTITLSQQEPINRQISIKQESSIIKLNYEDAISMANWLLENIREYLIRPTYL
ncbi:MAG: hypothetical protein ACFFFH_08355, partial [Candidatus Thorarchaeota archaeon]